jgi:hypothetical protein
MEKVVFQNKPSKEITNLSWFYKSYKQDPTIKSMLNMLDAIHEKYGSEKQNFFERLQRLQFYILPLNGFNLTDELYVKMNARGKQLTDFENFKADLIKWMKDETNSDKAFFNNEVYLNNRKMPYYLSFSQKLDTTWTQYFWQDTKNYNVNEKDKNGNLIYSDGKIVDPLFMRLFYRYFLNKYILKSSSDNKTMDKEEDYQTLYNESKYQNFDVFKKLVSQDTISKFEMFLEVLQNPEADILNNIQPSWQPENKKFTFYDKDITQSERIVFLGIMLFLEKGEYDSIKFKQWMRVVWNIVENTDINGHPPMIGAMKLIAELSEKSADFANIYEYLDKELIGNESIQTVPDERRALLEEKIKCRFIVNNPNEDWENSFIKAEQHQYFKGSIGFFLIDSMTLSDFNHRAELAKNIFDNNGINQKYRDNGHILLRALISQFTDLNSLITQKYFTDTDEGHKEPYLKRMLTSNQVVRKVTQEWFGLQSENDFENRIKKSVKTLSTISGWDSNISTEKRARRAHQALYQVPELQNWMQEKQAFRFDGRNYHLYVAYPRSWYDWIMLDSSRMENLMTEECPETEK